MKHTALLGGSNQKSKRKRWLRLAFLLLLLLALLLGTFVYFASLSGRSMINLDQRLASAGMSLSEEVSFANPKNSLTVAPLEKANDTLEDQNFMNIQQQAIKQEGQLEHTDIIAYTFYLKNTGDQVLDIVFSIKLFNAVNQLDEAVIIKLIESNEQNEVISELYFTKANVALPSLYQGRDVSHYSFESLIDILNFTVGSQKKYTILMWLDGALSRPSHHGGSVEFDMSFAIKPREVA